MSEKILIVDDEQEIADLVALYLENENFQVFKFYSAKDALRCIDNETLDMAILDVMLPDMNGFEICRKIREKYNYPVIMLTAKGEEVDKVTGLTLGADDYITKPFSLMALVSKVNALMRRLSKVQAQIMSSGEITVHMKTMQVYKGDEPVTLSKKEFSLLLYLWENAGQIVSKESILEHVWDIDGQFVDDNTVTVNISRLKNKLGTEEIANVRGLGYIWTGKVNKN